jgi:hypothetical protein
MGTQGHVLVEKDSLAEKIERLLGEPPVPLAKLLYYVWGSGVVRAASTVGREGAEMYGCTARHFGHIIPRIVGTNGAF